LAGSAKSVEGSYCLEVLGPIRLVGPEGPVAAVSELPARPRALLLLLALSKRYSRQSLIDVFWPGQDGSHHDPTERRRVNNNLDRLLTVTRQALGPVGSHLRSRQGVVSLRMDAGPGGRTAALDVDYHRFKRAVASSDPNVLGIARSLVRGAIASDLAIPFGVVDGWLEQAREGQRLDLATVLRKLHPELSDEEIDDGVARLIDDPVAPDEDAPVARATPPGPVDQGLELRRLARSLLQVSDALPSTEDGHDRLQRRALELLDSPDLLGSRDPAIQRDRILLAHLLDKLGIVRPGAGPAEGDAVPGAWVRIPAGRFEFGVRDSERALQGELRAVTASLEDDFLISRFPVTVAQFAAFLAATGSAEEQCASAARTAPATGVTWFGAWAYCEWLNSLGHDGSFELDLFTSVAAPLERQSWSGELGLQTELEWERSARFPDGRLHPWGDEGMLDAWTLRQPHRHSPTPVGAFPDEDSSLGVADLVGSVWQWCADDWESVLEEEWQQGEMRAIRGAGVTMDLRMLRTTCRFGDFPGDRRDDRGFRPVLRGAPSSS
jgi:formylglycine-generating enzyme required for sulfatase activity